jgi:hypothetical protein
LNKGESLLSLYEDAKLSVKEWHDLTLNLIGQCETPEDALNLQRKFELAEIAAKVNNDAALETNFREGKLRLKIFLGLWSRSLEKSKGGSNPQATLRSEANSSTKAEQLAEVGIKKDEANRCEQLVGPKDKQIEALIGDARETYLADQRGKQQPGTMKGLKKSVAEVLDKVFPKNKRTKKETPKENKPDLLVHFLYSADWFYRKRDFNPVSLAEDVDEEFAEEDIQAVELFIPLLEQFTKHLKERFPNVKSA